MRLRVRHSQGVLTLDDLTPEQSVEILCHTIERLINSPSDKRVQVSGGYPPKVITDRDLSLQAAGIKHGDTLTVTLIEASKQAQTSLVPQTGHVPSLASAIPAVPVFDGYLVQRVMEDDNSCLFRSIGYVLERDHVSVVPKLRQVIADAIEKDPETYSDVTLGQPRSKYIDWIKKDSSWGGAIELSIFSKYYGVEIVSVDVQTGRTDRFGEGSFDERVLILYSGIHYDALALSPMENCNTDFDETRFPVSDDPSLLIAAKKLTDILRQGHKYTDVANFTLKCEVCQAGLVGEKDAQSHASSTGHTNFIEYS